MRGHKSATRNYDNKKKITREGFRKVLKLFGYVKPYRIEYAIGMFFLLGGSLANLAFQNFLVIWLIPEIKEVWQPKSTV
jgi:hypothetical protein